MRVTAVRIGIIASATMLIVFASSARVPAAAAAEGSFERTLVVDGPVELDVRTGSGSITVRPGEAGRVHIVGRIRVRDRDGERTAEERVRAIESSPPIEQSGNVIRLGRLADREIGRDVSISFEVTVPARTAVRARSGSGSQSIGDLDGPVEVSSGSGSVTVGKVAGAVTVSTGSGSVELESAAGAAISTGSGSIRARQIGGAIQARTGSGSIDLAQSEPGPVEVGTGSGGIRMTGVRGELSAKSSSGRITVSGSPAGRWELSSSSGSIDLDLPDEAAFDLDVRTGSGRIDSDHPITVTGTLGRRELTGRVRGGGPLVRVRSSSGGVTIR